MSGPRRPIVYVAFGVALLVALIPAIRVTIWPIAPTIAQFSLIRCFGF
jgi:hypothetical protein